MAGYGIPEDEMVKLIPGPMKGQPIDPKTLRKYFRSELDRGLANANVRVMNGLFRNATTPTKINPGGHPILQIFWAKTRLGWKQPKDEAPPPAPVSTETVGYLEVARRVAFTLVQGARATARPMHDAAPQLPPTKRATAKA